MSMVRLRQGRAGETLSALNGGSGWRIMLLGEIVTKSPDTCSTNTSDRKALKNSRSLGPGMRPHAARILLVAGLATQAVTLDTENESENNTVIILK